MNEKIKDPELEIDGYTFGREDRETARGGGGGGCYICNDIGWQRRKDLGKDNIEAIRVEIFIKKSSPFLVSIIYRPPDTSRYLESDFENAFLDMLDDSNYENKETILLGDINVNCQNKSDNKEMKRIISQHGFKQVISKATKVIELDTQKMKIIFLKIIHLP